ncbi:MAG TPA: RNA methyltransferase [Oligoflexia bacterium]|nr:RNA methyltransferase [Oligoflexia bacterium]HMR25785.1 RNA methyltransferase [Oligoflexia bacterium]
MTQQQYELDLFTIRQFEYAINSPYCQILSISVSKQFLESRAFDKYRDMFSKLKKKTKIVESLESNRTKKDRGQIFAKVNLHTYHSSKSWMTSWKKKDVPARILLLDQVQDPQNLGAMVRTAKFFNYDAVMVSKRNSAPFSSTVVQASSGALFSLPIICANNLKREIDFLKENYFFCLGLDTNASITLYDSKFLNENLIIVMGNEGKGMRALTLSACDEVYKISQKPSFESLNVSAAASIAMYHFDYRKNKSD